MPNHLSDSHSPYLLQHKENPVDWYPWGEAAFDKARREDKPIFLSIGYSTCHWCHVMAHESFEDERVAQILNRDFVSIKVDREERPDIDAVYMIACQAMTGTGGWPLTIFMTPDQKPFHAATYLPKYSTYGRAGLLDTLTYLADVWKHNRARLLQNGDHLASALQRLSSPGPEEPSEVLAAGAYQEFHRLFDRKWGGFGAAPKFPSPHQLLFLMDYADRTHTQEAMDMAFHTLDAMAAGGMFDHIGGGFSRYSTDERWLKPHFEKMLYDNALLLLAYTEAYQRSRKPFYASVVRRTADYVLREMTHPEGGFYSAQDADSNGEEGKFYLFSETELRSVLGKADAGAFLASYRLEQGIINRIGLDSEPWPEHDERLSALRAYREARVPLHKDNKILTAWNMWMAAALARAGLVLCEERYLNAALRAVRFLRDKLTDDSGRLFLCWHDGVCSVPGQLDDYAVSVYGLLELYRCTLDAQYLELAIRYAEQLQLFFADEKKGGYYKTAFDAEALISRPKETYDGAIPSGNSVAAMALQQLAQITGEQKWLDLAAKQISYVAGYSKSYKTGASFGLLAVMRAVFPHRELVCCGEHGRDTLLSYLGRYPANMLSVIFKTQQNTPAIEHAAPFTRAYPIDAGKTMWYLCTNGACGLPQDSFDALCLTES